MNSTNVNFIRVDQRRGATLIVTMAVVSVVAYLLVMLGDNVMSVHAQTWVGLAKQKASYAAESVAADQENTLVQQAANNNLAGLETMTNYGVEWYNDCVVRWRIEPVRTTANDSSAGKIWSVNPPSNVSLYSTMSTFNGTDGTYVTNYDYYVFRVDTEAWALSNANFILPANPTTTGDAQMPWNNTGSSLATIQSSRVIQLRLNSLFKYCIFYAASGPTGDIEFHPGATLDIPGSVHSNGAIYMGGGGTATTAPPPNGSPVYIGGNNSGLDAPTTVVGVDGIFRMRKSLNYYNGVTNPMSVPIGSILNGGLASPYEINDLELNCSNSASSTYCNDSRNGPMLQSVYGSYVRDGITLGATTVSTLSNIPQLAGRPFEPVQEAPSGSIVYLINGTGSMTNPTNWTIHGGAGNTYPAAVPLVYKNPAAGDYTLDTYTWFTDPPTYPSPTSTQSVALPGGATIISTTVPATGMPLYGPTPGDITQLPTGPLVAYSFDSNELSAPYYVDAIQGKGDGTYGIVVRERPTQLTSTSTSTPVGSHFGWPDEEPTSQSSYLNLLNFFGLPNDGTAPSPSWLIYNHAANQYQEVAGTKYVVIEAEHAAGNVPTAVNSWQSVSGGSYSGGAAMEAAVNSLTTSATSATGLGRDFYPAPTATDTNREMMPRLDYYVKINDSGSYYPYLLASCNDNSFSNAADGSYVTCYVGLTPLVSTTSAAAPNNYLTYPTLTVKMAKSSSLAWYKPTTLPNPNLYFTSLPAGDYVMHVWMGDDSVVLDQVALYYTAGVTLPTGATAKAESTTTAGYTPAIDFPTGAVTAPALPFMTAAAFASAPLNPYQAEILYLKSQYAAIMGSAGGVPVDITNSQNGSGLSYSDYSNGFFGSLLADAALTGPTLLPVHEDNIMNRREAEWMRFRLLDSGGTATPLPAAYPNQAYKSYTVNTITLNINVVQAYIQANFSTTFNGLIYVGRTRRGGTPFPGYNPVLSPAEISTNYDNWVNPWGGWNTMTVDPGGHIGPGNKSWWEQNLPNPGLTNVNDAGARLNNRVPASGPDLVFHEAVRLAQGAQIGWGGMTTDTPPHIKGLTIVTPNLCYVQGDYNIFPDLVVSSTAPSNIASIFPSIPSPMTAAYMHTQLARADSGGLSETQLSTNVHYPPCAIFADQVTVLSNTWQDAGQIYNTYQTTSAAETWYNTSYILDNVPTDNSNFNQEGSGGVHNVARYIENWGGTYYHFRGSLVCMNAARYTAGTILSTPSEDTGCTMASCYGVPSRDLRFNTDLLTQSGQPPFSPFGVQVVRTVSTINDGNQ